MTRIHKLELENAKLNSELEDLKVNGVRESSERILELEKANKKLEMSARQSENLRVKDSESITALENSLTKAETNVKRLEDPHLLVLQALTMMSQSSPSCSRT